MQDHPEISRRLVLAERIAAFAVGALVGWAGMAHAAPDVFHFQAIQKLPQEKFQQEKFQQEKRAQTPCPQAGARS
jgi:hypothetical protein